ncbi:aldo/keto reductase [Wenzhouxiangella sp. AB-CW3]|uniref:aldo/keto reductase n=1 Tax=Wenzhouxiangella sp. AB-CW3 TaxID=2771012 RepID=UPI001CC2D5E3|nr:aldo/keto reductase [Wenzhouxiangella sp. AB-CW3]
MPCRQLGRSGPEVSVLGLGCASYWAHPHFPEPEARAVLASALEAGITIYDTGASYGNGLAERRLGRFLRELDVEVDNLVIATKAGTVRDNRGRLTKDFRPRSVVDQLEDSLRRLKLERVGLLQLHGPEVSDLSDELCSTLEKLRTAGKVERLGINGFSPVIEHAIGQAPFDVVMPFLSVVEPANTVLAQRAAEAGQGVLAAGPLARMSFRPPLGNWLTRRAGLWYLARALYNGPGAFLRARRIGRALTHPGWTPAQLAMAWTLEQPGITAAIFGTTRPKHVQELAKTANHPLPEQVRQNLTPNT